MTTLFAYVFLGIIGAGIFEHVRRVPGNRLASTVRHQAPLVGRTLPELTAALGRPDTTVTHSDRTTTATWDRGAYAAVVTFDATGRCIALHNEIRE